MQDNDFGSPGLKPKQPDSYDGRRDYLSVNTWLYKLEQYLSILMVLNPSLTRMSENGRVMLASTFLTGTAAVWWHTIVQMNKTPTTWDEFKSMV